MKTVMTVEPPIYTESLPPKIAILEDPGAHSPEEAESALGYAFGAMCSIREHRDEWLDALEPLMQRMAALGTKANTCETLMRGLLRLAEQAKAIIDGRDFRPTLPGDIDAPRQERAPVKRIARQKKTERKASVLASVMTRWADRRSRLEEAGLCDLCIHNWTVTVLEEPNTDLPVWTLEAIFKGEILGPDQIAELRAARHELATALRQLRAADVPDDTAADIFLWAEMPETSATLEPDPAPGR